MFDLFLKERNLQYSGDKGKSAKSGTLDGLAQIFLYGKMGHFVWSCIRTCGRRIFLTPSNLQYIQIVSAKINGM